MITRREFLKLTAAAGASLIISGRLSDAHAQGPTPTPPPYLKKGKITMADRQAAAIRAAESGLQPGVAPRTRTRTLLPVPGGTPDYFGPYPNFANSPLPGYGSQYPAIRKFVNGLAGLYVSGVTPLGSVQNNIGQYIPVAVPDTTTYSGSDYYEIELGQYTEKMHSDLPATKLEGYRQTNTSDPNVSAFRYLGPVIIAQKDRPVRIKFTNRLPPGSGGDLFIPTDTSIMGAGMGPSGGSYTQNRATLHLHGGNNPWISDGTPHQWTTPVGDSSQYPKGVSVQYVPDMDGGTEPQGTLTFYYTNQQSARLMFYHDHAYGITRLNVYVGQAAGYLLRDTVEQGLISSGVIPSAEIPLIIQDKTFVPGPAQLAAEDPTWDTNKYGGYGNLWFPHVYMPNQNPYDPTGAAAMGRWDYGPWFWPPYTGLTYQPIANPYYDQVNAPWEPPYIPATPNPSLVPEAFCDTPLVNGTAYPYLQVGQKAYRFRILNACNDRFLNLQLYYAKSNATMWDPTTGGLLDANAGEVNMVPAVPNAGLPASWPTDSRAGGAPDPHASGPSMVQIGSEGGFLPQPAVLPNTPIGYDYNRRSITVLNVLNKTLFLGPAERADVIVDFSGCPDGSKLILYNDAPAPVPAFDPRIDYYTGDPDQTAMGGAPPTQPGYGPNTRTILQFQVTSALGTAAPYDLGALRKALPAAYAQSQHKPIVPQADYNAAYNANYPNDAFVRIQDTAMTFTPAGGAGPITIQLLPKAIQELFSPDYGRMNAILGIEIPNTNFTNQTTIPYFYIDPPTEILTKSNPTAVVGSLGDGTQIWKITHNGVDTHAIHFHLYDVQLLNRVGWDGAIRPPDPNELGWKDTVRMNPLEDCIVAVRPFGQTLPWQLPNSIRPFNPALPIGSVVGFTNIDPTGLPIAVQNNVINFGYEYVWHCHLLGHEENDMMRAVILALAPVAPSNLAASNVAGGVRLNWRDNSKNETHWTVQRGLTNIGPWTSTQVPSTTGAATGGGITFTDTTVGSHTTYYYRILATNVVGDTTVYAAPAVGYPNQALDSSPSNVVNVTTP